MKLNRKERGNVMVESALVLVVFVAMLVGIFDVGQIFYLHQSITERVRAALRYGIVNSYDPAAIQNYVLYDQPTAVSGASTFFSLTPSMVSVERDNAGTTDDRITVTVSKYSLVFMSPFIAGTITGWPIAQTLPYEAQ